MSDEAKVNYPRIDGVNGTVAALHLTLVSGEVLRVPIRNGDYTFGFIHGQGDAPPYAVIIASVAYIVTSITFERAIA